MELRQLSYFIAVAERLSFSRAAESLHVAQPALSRAVQGLEDEIGIPLFVRGKPRIKLTGAGEAFLCDAQRLVGSSLMALETARRAARGEVGRLDLGYIAALSDGLIPRLLRRFRRNFPEVSLRMTQMRPARQVQALLTGEIHLGFIGLPVPDPTERLVFEPFRSDPMCVALPADHRLVKKATACLEHLANEPFIFLTRSGTPTFFDWLLQLCHKAGFYPRIVQEADSGQTVLELVAAGFGVALFSETAHHCWHEDVVFRRLAGDLPRFEHSVAWRRGEESPPLKAFLELLRSEEARARG